jgi:hypothetical protein
MAIQSFDSGEKIKMLGDDRDKLKEHTWRNLRAD